MPMQFHLPLYSIINLTWAIVWEENKASKLTTCMNSRVECACLISKTQQKQCWKKLVIWYRIFSRMSRKFTSNPRWDSNLTQSGHLKWSWMSSHRLSCESLRYWEESILGTQAREDHSLSSTRNLISMRNTTSMILMSKRKRSREQITGN